MVSLPFKGNCQVSWYCLYSFFQYLHNMEQLLKILVRNTFRSLFYSLAFQEISIASLPVQTVRPMEQAAPTPFLQNAAKGCSIQMGFHAGCKYSCPKIWQVCQKEFQLMRCTVRRQGADYRDAAFFMSIALPKIYYCLAFEEIK